MTVWGCGASFARFRPPRGPSPAPRSRFPGRRPPRAAPERFRRRASARWSPRAAPRPAAAWTRRPTTTTTTSSACRRRRRGPRARPRRWASPGPPGLRLRARARPVDAAAVAPRGRRGQPRGAERRRGLLPSAPADAIRAHARGAGRALELQVFLRRRRRRRGRAAAAGSPADTSDDELVCLSPPPSATRSGTAASLPRSPEPPARVRLPPRDAPTASRASPADTGDDERRPLVAAPTCASNGGAIPWRCRGRSRRPASRVDPVAPCRGEARPASHCHRLGSLNTHDDTIGRRPHLSTPARSARPRDRCSYCHRGGGMVRGANRVARPQHHSTRFAFVPDR